MVPMSMEAGANRSFQENLLTSGTNNSSENPLRSGETSNHGAVRPSGRSAPVSQTEMTMEEDPTLIYAVSVPRPSESDVLVRPQWTPGFSPTINDNQLEDETAYATIVGQLVDARIK